MPHILIVEDQPTTSWALSEGLSDDGYTVDTFGTAEEALELDREQRRAVQRVNKFNRRRSGSKQTISAKADFSYSRDDYRPLGLALFEKFVKPDPLPQRVASGGRASPKRELMVAETEAQTYGKVQGAGHKFSWEIDLTQVTLANFNYKKKAFDALEEALNNKLSKDQRLKVDYDYEKYKETFDKEMEKMENSGGY